MVSTRRQSRLFAIPPLANSSTSDSSSSVKKRRQSMKLAPSAAINHDDVAADASDVQQRISNSKGPGRTESDDTNRDGQPQQLASSRALPPKPPPAVKRHKTANPPNLVVVVATAPKHFLDGLHIHTCKDLLSIPDPPSPPPRLQRRLSSPLTLLSAASPPLRDLTNDEDADASVAAVPMKQQQHMMSSSSDSSLPARHSKRSRKSLCHVPSPVELPVVNDQLVTTRRKKKKRQSLLLLSDQDDDDDIATVRPLETVAPAFASQTTTTTAAATLAPCADPAADMMEDDSSISSSTTTFRHDKTPEEASEICATMAEMRKLVHAYTSLPCHERESSTHRQAIEQRTGYIITPPVQVVNHQAPRVSNASRADLFISLGPELKNMDRTKHATTNMVQQITACRVYKASNGRNVRYQHVPSGRTISSAEYEQRYMTMLEEIRAIRSRSWGVYFDRFLLSQQQQPKATSTATTAVAAVAAAGKVVRRTDNKCRDDDDAMKICEEMEPIASSTNSIVQDESSPAALAGEEMETDLIIEEMAVEATDAIVPDESQTGEDMSMVTDETSTSSGMGGSPYPALDEPSSAALPGSQKPAPQEEKPPSRDLSPDAKALPRSPGFVVVVEDSTTSEEEEDEELATSALPLSSLSSSQQQPPPPSLLPLPSRDEESCDPDIARAEAKLWRAIDQALETYSSEVLAIRAGRTVSPQPTET